MPESTFRLSTFCLFTRVALALGIAIGALAPSGPAAASGPELQARYMQMRRALAASPLGRPVQLSSSEGSDGLQGEVYAVVDRPIGRVVAAFGDATHWCDALLLHINNRDCQIQAATAGQTDPSIVLDVVRKADQSIDSAFRLGFQFKVTDASADHLQVMMTSASGPFGTSNYKIMLEAVPVDGTHSFLHFSYSYDEGFFAHTATAAYLATFGSHKVGFTRLAGGSAAQPEFIRGTRGLVERNAMRYFLAVDAYLSVPPGDAQAAAQQRERTWYASTERYARQLHEIDMADYLALKRSDSERRAARR